MATATKVEWWAEVPDVPDPEPTLATITFHRGEEARRFGTVLQRVVDATAKEESRPVLNCVQMQTAQGLWFAAADGFRLGVAEYRPVLERARTQLPVVVDTSYDTAYGSEEGKWRITRKSSGLPIPGTLPRAVPSGDTKSFHTQKMEH